MAPKKRPLGAGDDDEAFPRGGSDGLTALERREVLVEAEKEVERELALGSQPGKKKTKGGKRGDDGEASFLGDDHKANRYVELLKFKKLVVGQRLWGMVQEVSPRGLVVSLPHGLRGHVAPKEASDVLHKLMSGSEQGHGAEADAAEGDAAKGGRKRARAAAGPETIPPLPSLFHVGQFVRAAVVGLSDGGEGAEGGEGGRKVVNLSLRLKKVCAGMSGSAVVPGAVLPAVVRGVEDHGFTLSFGVKGVTGFLPRRVHEAAFGEGAALLAGALLDVAVTKAPDGRGVTAVTTDPNTVATAVVREVDGLSLEALLPGSLVPARVTGLLRDGLNVSLFTFFHAAIDPFHLGAPLKSFSPDQKLKARVLYVNPATKEIGLSLLPHLINLTLPTATPMLGQVFDEATVTRVDSGLGVLLSLPLDKGAGLYCPAYCHVSNVSDSALDKPLDKAVHVNSKMRVRVIGFRLVDGLATVTAKQSMVDRQVVGYGDVQPGMPLAGIVKSTDSPAGLVVEIAPGVRALVPVIHMSDLGTEAARKKFKEGKKVEGRVLAVDPSSRKMVLTLKPALLGSRLPIIAAVEHAAPGLKTHGVVTGVKEFGVFVSFYGGVSGMAPVSELGLPAGTSPTTVYSPGQVVRARVVSVDVATRKITLSLKAKAGATAEAQEGATASVTAAVTAVTGDACGGLQPGDIVTGEVKSLMEGKEGSKSTLILEVKSEDGGAGATAVLGRLELPGHLSDHPGGAAALLPHVTKPGTKLGPLVVLGRLEGAKSVLVSRKASLVAAARAGQLPRAFEEVTQGALVSGYVANVTADSVFVRFGAHVTGRAGLSQLADSLVSDPRRLFAEGQSVRAQVVTVDAGKQRFAVTLRPSATSAKHDASYLSSLFRDLELAESLREGAEGGASADWSVLGVGSCVAGCVHVKVDYGLLVDLEANEDLVGVVRPHQQPPGTTPATGTPLACRVLDLSKSEGILDLSARPDLLAGTQAATAATAGKTPGKKGKAEAGTGSSSAELQPGMEVEAVVELVKEAPLSYAVLSFVAPTAAAPATGKAGAAEGTKGKGKAGAPEQLRLLAFAAATDYNAAVGEVVKRKLVVGSRVRAMLQELPATANGHRLLAAVDLTRMSDGAPGAGGSGAAVDGAPRQKLAPGTVVSVTVLGVGPSQAEVQVGKSLKGRIHISESGDLPSAPAQLLASQAEALTTGAAAAASKKGQQAKAGATSLAVTSPLDSLAVGQTMEAVCLGRGGAGAGMGHHGVLDFSVRPSLLAAARKGETLPAGHTFASLSVGQVVAGIVSDVENDHLWLSLGPGVRGRVHVLDLSTDPEVCAAFVRTGANNNSGAHSTSAAAAAVAAGLKVGRVLAATVVAVDQKKHTLDLSLLQPLVRPSTAGDAKASKGAKRAGPAAGSGPSDGSSAYVSGAELSAVASGSSSPAGSSGALVGRLVMGKVAAVKGVGGVRVTLGQKVQGKVGPTDIHDEWVPNALEGVMEGAFVRARVVAAEGEGPALRLQLSLRPSRGGAVAGRAAAPAAGADGAAPEALPEPLPAAGASIRGYVKRVDKGGVFVALDRTHDARIKLRDLSDGFIEDPAAAFPEGARVEGRVLPGGDSGRIELTLRSADKAAAGRTLTDFKEGQVVSGRVRRVEKFGVFVELANSTVVGLAHISELADGKVKDINALFRPKQSVRARILSIDGDKGRLSLSLKPSQVEGEEEDEGADGGDVEGSRKKRKVEGPADLDAEMADEEEESEEGEGEEGDSMEEDEGTEDEGVSDEGSPGADVDIDDMDDDEDEDEEDEGEEEEGDSEDADGSGDGSEGVEEEEEDEEPPIPAADLRRQLAGDAILSSWTGLQLAEDEGAPKGQGEGDEGAKHLSKAAKKRAKAEHERAVREAELARARGGSAPQSAQEFEAAVLGAPSSSYTWIRYMAWLLGLGEADKARAIAQRALDTINYREEGEKFNIWVALLNLEAAFGGDTPAAKEASLTATFQKALPYCNQKKLYFALLGILDKAGHTELAATTLKTMCKKFSASAKVWLRAMQAGLASPDAGEGVKGLMDRALSTLPKRKHIKVITGAALLELREGSAERGRGILEGVLRNYPKRLDLWSLYIDQEIKLGDVARTRTLFERVTTLPLPARKMKCIFKRWLEWEKSAGDDASVEHVKARAMEFVESSAKA